jgi:hypothetical protein
MLAAWSLDTANSILQREAAWHVIASVVNKWSEGWRTTLRQDDQTHVWYIRYLFLFIKLPRGFLGARNRSGSCGEGTATERNPSLVLGS